MKRLVVRRELAPLVVGLARTGIGAEVWAVNASLGPESAELDLRTWTLDGEPMVAERRRVSLLPYQATELGTFHFDANRPLVLSARLLTQGRVVARATMWPEPFKYFRLPDPAIELTKLGDDRLRLSAARPAKGVLLSAKNEVRWSDNMLDLMPDEVRIILADGLGVADPQVRWLSGKFRRGMAAPPAGTRVATAEEKGWSESWSAYNYEHTWDLLDELYAVAEEAGKHPAQVAINWLLQRPAVTAPIIGARTMEQLEINLGSSGWSLDAEQMARLDRVSQPGLPYPYDVLANNQRE